MKLSAIKLPKLTRQQWAALLIAAIVALGIFARFNDLAWHFSNNDDLRGVRRILEPIDDYNPFFSIPKSATNAPLQSLLTTLLISKDQTYRDLLFWGRLPSCIMGILALFAMIAFYRKWEGKKSCGIFLGLSLLALSWENIAFAKQTYSYAIGVLALVCVLWMFAHALTAEKMDLKRMLLLGLGLAIACNAQYQILLFVPPFFLILFLSQWPRHQNKGMLLLCFLVGAVFLLALLFPTWHFFLQDKFLKRGIETTPCPGAQADAISSGHFLQMARVWLANLFPVFRSKIGFVPEETFLFRFWSYLLFGFFVLGILGCALSKEVKKRCMLLFFILVLGVWSVFWAQSKVCFDVSRHTLILLPFFCIFASEGLLFSLGQVAKRVKKLSSPQAQRKIAGCVGIAVVASSMLFLPQFFRERRDLLDENELFKLFLKYPPHFMTMSNESLGLEEMKTVWPLLQSYIEDRKGFIRALVYMSRYPLPGHFHDKCEEYRTGMNFLLVREAIDTGEAPNLFDRPCHEYKIVHSQIVQSDVQLHFSKSLKHQMYSNSLHFYIAQTDQLY